LIQFLFAGPLVLPDSISSPCPRSPFLPCRRTALHFSRTSCAAPRSRCRSYNCRVLARHSFIASRYSVIDRVHFSFLSLSCPRPDSPRGCAKGAGSQIGRPCFGVSNNDTSDVHICVILLAHGCSTSILLNSIFSLCIYFRCSGNSRLD